MKDRTEFKKTFKPFEIKGLEPRTRREIKLTDFAKGMKSALPRIGPKSVKLLQARYKAEADPLNFDLKKFELEMGHV